MADALDEAIASIAVLTGDREAFARRAVEVATQFDASVMDDLRARFHAPLHPEPEGFGVEQCGLGGWMSYWQFAIFELYFQFGEAALPVLREVAFGPYDWTQANAVEVLLRLAAQGIQRERIIEEIRHEFPSWRFEAQLYVVQAMQMAHAAADPALAEVVAALADLDEWQEAVEELRPGSH